MTNLDSISTKFKRLLGWLFAMFLVINFSYGQDTFADTLNCSGGTPTFIADLSSNSDSIWTSASVPRAGSCCTPPDNNCVQFVVSLAADAEGLELSIPSGCGTPPSSITYYEIDCGTPTILGTSVCLAGGGTYVITYCASGSSSNCFQITSFSTPETSLDQTVTDGCTADLAVQGLIEGSIIWRSVSPGSSGTYDPLIDCTAGCDTTIFTPAMVSSLPGTIGYEVCGTPMGGCTSLSYCDTIHVNVVPELDAVISPTAPSICFGTTDVDLTVSGVGGLAPYSYLWNTGETTSTITASSTGTYFVEISDALGCGLGRDTVVVTEFLSAITANAGSDITMCGTPIPTVSLSGSITGTSTAIWSGGAGTFSPDATALNATYTPTAAEVSAGSVTLTLTTTNNGSCTLASDDMTLNLTSFDATVDTVDTHVDCIGNFTGAIDLILTGGATPITYLWNTGATTEDLTGLAAGTYSVTMTDVNGCTNALTVPITEPPLLTASATATDISCPTSHDGAVDLTVAGGTAPYTYAWDNGAIIEDLSGLSTGTFTVIVTDANGCTATASATVGAPTALNATSIGTDILCFGGINGAVDLTVTGGTTPYSFAWSNGWVSEDLTGMTAGVYTVTITDNNGCTFVSSTTLTEPPALTGTTVVTHPSCYGAADGVLDVTISGGVPPYSYAWDSGSITEDLTEDAGIYTNYVRDAHFCLITQTGTLVDPPEMILTFTSTDVSCEGLSDGNIDITVTGGTGTYTYSWSNGSVTEDLPNVTADTYTIVVTDANGCTVTETITITEPIGLEASFVTTDVDCFGASGGAIDVTVTGGTIPYTYSWSTGSFNEDISGLTAGTYTLTITDASGCEITVSATVSEPDMISNTIVATNLSCFESADGAIDVTTSGGTGPYTYSWNNGATTEDISGLIMGSYDLTVTDDNGCTHIESVLLTQPDLLEISSTSTPVSCFSGNDGAIDITLTGGTLPYTYAWDNGEVTEDLTSITAGTYSVVVTDANGCDITTTVVITEPDDLLATAAITNLSCYGVLDGAIDITTTGGTLPYTYAWATGELTEDLAGLSGGVYTITITDDNGCSTTSSIAVNEPDTLETSAVLSDVNCFEGSDGEIDLIIDGGTPPYAYVWSTGDFDEDRIDLTAGTYSVVVTDNNGCEASFTGSLTEPTELTGTFTVLEPTCSGFSNANIDVTTNGGTLPYTYNWSTGEDTEDLTDVLAGDYTLTTTDGNGCELIMDISVGEPLPLATIITGTDETCDELNDGSVDLTVSGGIPPYAYAWNTGEDTEDLAGLDAGFYEVNITDDNGCTTSTSISIDFPIDYDAGRDSSTAICSGLGALDLDDYTTATISGTWSEVTASGQFDAPTGVLDLTDLPAGDYVFTYTIPSYTPCTNTMATITVTVYPVPVINFSADQTAGCDQIRVTFTSTSDIALGSCYWDFGDGSTSTECGTVFHTYEGGQSYDVSLQVVSPEGCEAEMITSNAVLVGTTPTADFSFSPSNPTINETEVAFENYSENAATFDWNFGDNRSTSTDYEPTHTYDAIARSYTITLTAYDNINPNCQDVAQHIITVEDIILMYVPNAFTPTGSSYNNTFRPIVTAGIDVYDYRLTVYNRWGELVFESFDPSVGWTGTYGEFGDLSAAGIYVWKIDFKETMSDKMHNLFGNVNLIR